MTEKQKPRAIGKLPTGMVLEIDHENAAEIAAKLDELKARALRGEVIAIVGIVVTDDPADDLCDEGLERIEEGFYDDDAQVYMLLESLAEEVRDSWRLGFYGPDPGDD